MTIRRAVIVASTGLVLTAALVAAPASAQEGPFAPISLNPTSGPPGTVITVSGEGCGEPGFPGSVEAYFGNEEELLAQGSGDAASDGTWSVQVTVPDALDPAPLYLVTATCFVDSGDGPQPDLDYDIVEFDVTDGTVTPPVTPPTTPTTPTTPATPPVAPAATPVPGDPNHAG